MAIKCYKIKTCLVIHRNYNHWAGVSAGGLRIPEDIIISSGDSTFYCQINIVH